MIRSWPSCRRTGASPKRSPNGRSGWNRCRKPRKTRKKRVSRRGNRTDPCGACRFEGSFLLLKPGEARFALFGPAPESADINGITTKNYIFERFFVAIQMILRNILYEKTTKVHCCWSVPAGYCSPTHTKKGIGADVG